jgi:hypothetical protein
MRPYRHLARRARPGFIALLLVLSAILVLAPASVFATAVRYPKAEARLLEMINCTRTGGWVRADGSCDGYGSGRHSAYRKPLRLHEGVSRDVARPYAKLMAERDVMSHYLDGSPSTRFRRAGYEYSWIGENIGWSSRRPHGAVLYVHRIMQAEKSYDGPHWGNIKKRQFKTVGIGVWRHGGKTYIATDFYTPLR